MKANKIAKIDGIERVDQIPYEKIDWMNVFAQHQHRISRTTTLQELHNFWGNLCLRNYSKGLENIKEAEFVDIMMGFSTTRQFTGSYSTKLARGSYGNVPVAHEKPEDVSWYDYAIAILKPINLAKPSTTDFNNAVIYNDQVIYKMRSLGCEPIDWILICLYKLMLVFKFENNQTVNDLTYYLQHLENGENPNLKKH